MQNQMLRVRRAAFGAAVAFLLPTLLFAQEAPKKVKPGPKLRAAGANVAVPMAALGKEYLMSISMIPQEQAPTSSGLAGRIVTFELFDDTLDMYEATQGFVVTDDLPSRRLLASFPIVKTQQNAVIIDFNAGMRRVFTSSWIGRSSFNPDGLATVLEAPLARVFSVEEKGSSIAIRQAVQARSRSRSQDIEQRMEIRYFITPYKAGSFKSKPNLPTARRYVQFFQTMPLLELNSGRAEAGTARFDASKPIKFYYSANTPEPYVEAIRQGVLYWNKAFGKDIVTCEKAPEGISAPSAQHNIIQWVPWDSAGFAYADILVDPRTGESMHGQAFMTSVFAISGVQRARLVLRRMKALEAKEAEKEEKKDGDKDDDDKDDDDKDDEKKLSSHLLGLPMFRKTASCECDMGEYARQMAIGIENMLAVEGVEDAGMLRASQDYVLNVTAHEVGHVLGLRHNFAGSLEANVSPKDLKEWFEKYVKEEDAPEMKEKLTTSSVMEYSVFEAAVFSGWKMRTSDEVLPHDKAAIQWGYFDDNSVIESKMLFATDDDVFRYGDVNRFDYGAEPIVGAMSDVGRRLNGAAISYVEKFIAAKAPRDKRDAIPLEQVNLNASSDVALLIMDYREALKWFSASVRSLKVERDFPYIGDLNEDERYEAHWKYLNSQVEKVGGIDRLVFGFAPLPLSLDLKGSVKDAIAPSKFDAAKMTAKIGELLETDAYKSFVGADGKTYSFSDEEKKIIQDRAKPYFDEYESELVKRLLQTWGSTKRDLGGKVRGYVIDDDIVAKMEKNIIAAAKVVIMTRDEKNKDARIAGKVDKAFVEVVDFKYDLATRVEAAKSIADATGSYPAWAKETRVAIGKELKSVVDMSLNINNFKEFSDSKLSRSLRNWYLDQQNVLRLLK